MHKLNFLNPEIISEISKKFPTPLYVYSENKILDAISNFKSVPFEFDYQIRYAMKANSNINILKIFKNNWVFIDASSEYEVLRALNAWFLPHEIQLSTQEMWEHLKEFLDAWVFVVATSLNQLKLIWELAPNSEIWVRINPWVWSGAFKAIATWWLTSSFWIWHEYIAEILKLEKKYNLKITKINLHIGSEKTPESWVNTANIGLDFVNIFKNCTCLDMWWGFKMAIMQEEKTADLNAIFAKVNEKFSDFYAKTGRKIKLEVEPGKYMVINSCSVLTKVVDVVSTWDDWYNFVKINSWMTQMPRVTMYWVQQPIIAINNSKNTKKYVVVGHCCESGDILTTKLYDQETIEEVELSEVNIWDILVFEWTWAYNSSMCMKNYNSFPEVWEVMILKNWEIKEIRKVEKINEIWRNEIEVI